VIWDADTRRLDGITQMGCLNQDLQDYRISRIKVVSDRSGNRPDCRLQND